MNGIHYKTALLSWIIGLIEGAADILFFSVLVALLWFSEGITMVV
jgi:hypothetical protein